MTGAPVYPADLFLSTPSARRATSAPLLVMLPQKISIHALREEGDLWGMGQIQIAQAISIHALREEGDAPRTDFVTELVLFLSTPSARRATRTPMPSM